MTDLTLLLWLVLAHVLGDFYLQPQRWVDERNRRHSQSVWLPVHALLHALLACAVVWLYGMASHAIAATFLMMFLSHYLTDLAKSYRPPHLKWLVLDQLFHLFWLVVIWLVITQNHTLALVAQLGLWLNPRILVVALAYLLVFKPASVMVATLLGKWHLDFEAVTDLNVSEESKDSHTLASAGEYIGYIERGLIVTFLLSNQLAAVGFVLAAKSVFRFGDLKDRHDRKFTEYVMIGTFASMAIAFVIGLLARLAIQH
ncbi:conserved hypothetical protein [Ferrimonas balearica DSM 9799]|uniref:DUF3307 domain-containing protein n=1 Tax=Ferrimonas balearica (strain DSM 9799 / CCM 4581 / KCTC 23876 / PAT) TaxID=550540 RepID=E1SUD8_FERBD|nr:DUF3307 domain-containing protein [Ferrimonas balearica]ADN76271.1 conserved hypothetical protein [Ferrimonas balearica DSM 9799]